MTRIGWVLIALLTVLLVAGWYFLVYEPTSQDIEDVQARTEQVRTETMQEQRRAAELREVRASAPEGEAALAAGELLIPEFASIPALLRQLQQSADAAGVRLSTVAPGSPSVTELGEVSVAVMDVTMSVTGTYFQIVDLARRIEDPGLTPRALRWTSASMSPSEYPELSVTLGGQVYARDTESLPALEEDEIPAEETDGADDAEDDAADAEGDEVDS